MKIKGDSTTIFRFSGLLFMMISTALFYESLYVAAGNPGFFVVVYFDYFGEGLIELVAFTAFIPFIGYTVIKEIKDMIYWR